ncbi:MAG: alkaline phosphatase family protein [Bacteroidales bacterium]|nr:alkaline phosphatase family protein [Bacteroidales bacterium]
MYKLVLTCFCCSLILTGCVSLNKTANCRNDCLVVLSMDGFRGDYPDRFYTPNLDKMARRGVKAKALIPVFPSVTFPNHYTMATGLYPDHHGIVHNTFYDSTLNYTYKISDRKAVEDGRFYGGEPIWNTAEKQGITTGIFYWVGSEADIQQMHPTYWKKYDQQVNFEQRIDTVMKWLSFGKEKRPELIMFYFDEPDHSGHLYGPDSKETGRVVTYCDSLVGVFRHRIKEEKLARNINFIVISDHGMGALDNSRKVILNDKLNPIWIKRINGSNPVIMIEANEGCADSIVSSLRKLDHISAWRKEEIPETLHYGTNARVNDIVVLADSSWAVTFSDQKISGGAHGYDPANSDMHAVFYACGPAFKRGKVIQAFEHIHLYSLFCKLLDIEPVKTDGNEAEVNALFR